MTRNTPKDFWSRRRAGVAAEQQAEVIARQKALETAEAEAVAADQAEKTDAEILEGLGLSDPDLMKMGDDFSAFMNRAVPEHLRRRALRKLWLSNPVLANLDGLCDHNDDFSDAATVLPDMKTSYQIGKGMMQHVIALAEAAEKKDTAQTGVDVAEPEGTLSVQTVSSFDAEAEDDPTNFATDEPLNDALDTPALADHVADNETDPETLARPRRMRFAFVS
jgi:hypothetical protein